MDEKLLYDGYVKGAFFDDINKNFNLIFGNDYDNYLLKLNFLKGKDNITEKYDIKIEKTEDTLIDAKFVYLPKKIQDVKIDLNVINKKDIDYFNVNGILAINDNNVHIYTQNLMPANIYQLQEFLELNSDLKEQYLKDLYHENYEIIDYPVSNKPLSLEEQFDILAQIDINDFNRTNDLEHNFER